jgi:hypothetical protein
MRKVWSIEIDGRQHRVDVAWDVQLSGGGCIMVDGQAVDTWSIGVKFPGVSRRFLVGRRRARVKQRWLDFDLYVDEARVPQESLVETGGTHPGPAPYRTVALVLVVGAIALLLFVYGLVRYVGAAP